MKIHAISTGEVQIAQKLASRAGSRLPADGSVDGVGPDLAKQKETKRCILQFAAQTSTVFLPTHVWDAARRLELRDKLIVP